MEAGAAGSWTHKSIKRVGMDNTVFLYHHSPLCRLPLPHEPNYLLSLLTLDDCSFPMAGYHLYHWYHVPIPDDCDIPCLSQPCFPSGIALTRARSLLVIKSCTVIVSYPVMARLIVFVTRREPKKIFHL